MLFIFILLVLAPLTTSKQYRSDYVYNKQTDAFYKLHIESRREVRARQVCQIEGASLMDTSSDLDIAQFHNLFKRFPDLGEYAWVHDDDLWLEAADDNVFVMGEEERPESPWDRKCDVLSRDGELTKYRCSRMLPFICKVNAADAVYDATCNVYGKNYKFIQELRSCYKVSQIGYTWNEAYAECENEGAHLVVLNSVAEDQALVNLTRRVYVIGAVQQTFFFAGFRANKPTDGKPREFRTIFNQTLEEAGFAQWSENEPNNSKNSEYCGSVLRSDGKLNDLDCSHKYPFVCEKEIQV